MQLKKTKRMNWPGILLVFVILFGEMSLAADWPYWQGPNRDAKSAETGLLKEWPAEGPEIIWEVEGIGKGYSSPSIANGKLFITGIDENKQEMLSAFDLDGKLLWRKTYGTAWEKSFPEARTTPTIDGDRVYVISGMGKVVCLDSKTGTEKWSVNGGEKFGMKYGRWGTAESPLVFDNKVIFTPVGDQTTMVALDKMTGATLWMSKSLNDESAYVTPALIEKNGKKLLVTVTANYIVGLNGENGDIWWTYDYVKAHDGGRGATINTNTPLYHNGQIYVTSGYNHVGVKLNLSPDLKSITLAWADPTLDVHHGGVVLVDGYLYGANWLSNSNGNWVALNWETGKPAYEKTWENKGSILYADGMLYCFEEKQGNIALVKTTPKDFEIVSSFKFPKGDGPAWAHPVINDKRLYLRRGDVMIVYDVRAERS